jgi:hypothetical protein
MEKKKKKKLGILDKMGRGFFAISLGGPLAEHSDPQQGHVPRVYT